MMRDAMAVVDEVLTQPADVPAVRRRRIGLRLIAGFVVGVLAAFAVAGAALLAWDSSYEGRILPGVRVGSVDVSGLDRTQAVEALSAGYRGLGEGRVIVRTSVGEAAIPYAGFARRADVEAMTDEAMAVGRSGTVAERALAEVRLALDGRTLGPHLALDEAALASAVETAVAGFEVTPIDASIAMSPRGVATTPARTGRTFDGAAAAAAALAAVRAVDAPPEVVVEARAVWTSPALSDADVALAATRAQRMIGNVVVTFRAKKWTIKASTVRRWVGFEVAADGSVQPVVDVTKIPAALGKVAKVVQQNPVSATYLKSGRRIVGVAPASYGRRLDAETTAAAIGQALVERGKGSPPASVAVSTAKVAPKLTTEEAVKHGPLMSLLGSWKTWFPISERNYFGANIWLPAKFIDGTVLFPGQRFEWWSAVGPITTARGFGLGGFIAGDHTEPTGAIGGGMCSSSTTLFNAALRAGLRMGARSNHKYYITRYPLGLDATVSKTAGGGGQTMSFTNDMKTPIVIRSFRYTSKGLGWVRYEIWGIPDGRTVSFTKPAVSNLRKATTYRVYTSRLPHGVTEQTEYPSNGMDVSVTRTVRDGHGRVIHRETYRSHYTLWNGRIEVGQ